MKWLVFFALVTLAQAGVRKPNRPLLDAAKPRDGMKSDGNRIIGGNVATHGQFPYMADIWMNTGSFCGASLISETVVLTAGHCVEGAGSVDVWVGTQNVYAYPPERTMYKSERIIMHPQYAWPSNDIALIIVPTVTFTNFVQPVRLPRRSDVGNSFVGTSTSFSGWGAYYDGSSISEELKFLTNVPVITNVECYSVYGSIVIDSHICTYTDNSFNGCLGDSGGPLVYDEGGAPTQLGVYAFITAPSCLLGPGGFTRLTSYLDWIQGETGIQIRP